MVKADATSWSVDTVAGSWAKNEQCDFCQIRRAQYVTEFSINWHSPSVQVIHSACAAEKLVSCEQCHADMKAAFADGKVTVTASDLDAVRVGRTSIDIEQG